MNARQKKARIDAMNLRAAAAAEKRRAETLTKTAEVNLALCGVEAAGRSDAIDAATEALRRMAREAQAVAARFADAVGTIERDALAALAAPGSASKDAVKALVNACDAATEKAQVAQRAAEERADDAEARLRAAEVRLAEMVARSGSDGTPPSWALRWAREHRNGASPTEVSEIVQRLMRWVGDCARSPKLSGARADVTPAGGTEPSAPAEEVSP